MKILFNIPAEIHPDGGFDYDMNQFVTALQELKKPQKRNVRILIIEDYKNVTKKQLNYYYGILLKDVLEAFHSIGERMTEKEADEIIRKLFLSYYKTNISTGRKMKIIRSLDSTSHDFPNTKQISTFFEDVVQYCAENMNFIIHLPNDLTEIDLNFNRINEIQSCKVHTDINNCADFRNTKLKCIECSFKNN